MLQLNRRHSGWILLLVECAASREVAGVARRETWRGCKGGRGEKGLVCMWREGCTFFRIAGDDKDAWIGLGIIRAVE